MAEAAVTFLLEQLKEVVLEYRDLILDGEDEFELLKSDLYLLQAFLKDSEKDPGSSHLKRRIREVVYEVEDTIDFSLTMAINAKANRSSRSAIFRTSKKFSFAIEVKFLRENKVRPLLDEASKFADMQRVAGDMENPQATSKRDAAIRQNRVVGLEDDEAIIIGYLMEKTKDLDVISIMGRSGQGKTTLAGKIYQNYEIYYHFPIRIWVTFSQEFNRKDVFLQILRKFTPSHDMSNLDHNELAQTVRTRLEKQKFLLVLDNLWSVDAWNQIKEVLPHNNGEGKVLITSQEIEVGRRSTVYREPFHLRFLNSYESWTLLQYVVFGNLEDCPQELRPIGEHIAVKCDGVPLTIVMVGCILAEQLKKSPSSADSGWEMVEKNVTEALQSDVAQQIPNVVALSLRRLPYDLRRCFLFLGVFPEDYEISAKMLCELWISEGFVQARDGKNLEEIAEENMNDLITRNLLEVEKTNHMGKVKTCRVHDIIRAFCVSISKNENFCQEIKRSKQGALEPSVSEVQKSRRLCFRSDLSKFLSEKPFGPHVRSFLCFYEGPVKLEPGHISAIPDRFRNLRILESRCIKLDQFPEKVAKLVFLKYLTLYIETLKILPESIAQLQHLQSLVVETKSRSITMKANMWKMFRLRCLKTRAAIVLDNKLEGEAGENLHTLSILAAESCIVAVSRRARNLKTLGISGKLACIFETDFLENLHQLEKLKLECCITNGFPQGNCFPPNLKRLTLANTLLGWQHMSTLAMIKSLEALKLKDNAFVGVSWRVDDYSFPSLQLLLMVNMDLFLWETSADAFPHLRFLVVKNCENLREIPVCLGRHLEKLEIYRVRRSVIESAMKIAEKEKSPKRNRHPFNLTHSIVDLRSDYLFGKPSK